MVKLFRTELTATGRPVLLQGEVERGMLDKVRRRRQWEAVAQQAVSGHIFTLKRWWIHHN